MRDGELGVLERVVYTAAAFREHVPQPPMEELLASDHFRPYIENWGRPGDRCLIVTKDDEPIGGAWYRLFAPPWKGDGYIDEQTPELGIGLFGGNRGGGIGRALLGTLITQARLDGYAAISLGVADDNRAGNLYEAVGFQLHRKIPRGRIMVYPLNAEGIRHVA